MVHRDIITSANGARSFLYGPDPSASHNRASSSITAEPSAPEALTSVRQPRTMTLAFAGINLPPVKDKDAYVRITQETGVRKVIEEIDDDDELNYQVMFEDYFEDTIPLETLLQKPNGRAALQAFQEASSGTRNSSHASETSESGTEEMSEPARRPKHKSLPSKLTKSIDTKIYDSDSDSESDDEISVIKPSTSGNGKQQDGLRITRGTARTTRISAVPVLRADSATETNDSESSEEARRKNNRTRSGRATRSSRKEPEYIGLVDESDDTSSSDEDIQFLQSDVLPRSRKRKRGVATRTRSTAQDVGGLMYEKPRRTAARRSERTTRHQRNMEEVGINDVYKSDSENARRPVPKAIGARETYKPLPGGNKFHLRHCQQCDTCGKYGSGPYGQLIHCQGCSLSYHRNCLGTRNSRDHLVTKIGHADFVLQCRRCINHAQRKDITAPDQAMCQVCREVGQSCVPFRERKSAAQEERDREENDGEDPVAAVDPDLINDANNVLFRCVSCWRGFHFHHLRSKSDEMDIEQDDERIADQRFREYAKNWQCIECDTMPTKSSLLVAWRPIDLDTYITGLPTQDVNEDDKEYLIKWDNLSYFQCQWMPGAWTWGVIAISSRRAFLRKDDGNNLPTMNTEDAIPEDYLRIDIVLDVRFTSIVDTRAEEIDKARIREVDRAYIKYKGLGYEDVVWEKVPGPDDGDRWTDWVSAYDDWVKSRYIRCPKTTPLKARLEKARSTDFSALEKEKQPETLTGGELMKYQLEGINWLYYRWYLKQNAILADEMGLGKTIQIIGFLATLVAEHNCFPFLVVVPNSTCPNWRREIKRWAPSLRVVAYYGSAAARVAAYQYELYPEGAKDLRAHIVVTSYDAAGDDSCRKFFKNVPWQGLIVDEGQRLKSDKTLLYTALGALKIPFRVLLTGTPMQNNPRELFNLLQFLDESFDAVALDLEYAQLTKENVPQLHNLIRSFFLRRTKAQVLTFLPPMAQIIIPVSMSVLQKKLYMSILARNPDLVRAIFDSRRSLKQGERANLNNILMQLRKCLCHPFVYSREIEERDVTTAVSHRNLVEASAKLQLLEILLPKLKERGHRVLIFSQFLNMLDIMEDFLDGLELAHQRLDGTISTLQKQKRIDEFNAPNSKLFAFLLSTRAGGVGINLATADTVIILDPDFNPHQDIQALSRAHRIGQKNKVLCFQLMTKLSAEEKIVQIGRRKMALDHVLIEHMGEDEGESLDVESILRFGATEIMEGTTQEIRYDDASIDKLLDRSQVEDTKAGEDNSAESQFSFARVWANDTASMMDSLGSDDEGERAPDTTLWEKILKEREKLAAEEAAARQQVLGRGKRARQNVDYSTQAEEHHAEALAMAARTAKESDSDTDFQEGHSAAEESAAEEGDEGAEPVDAKEIEAIKEKKKDNGELRGALSQPKELKAKEFRRSRIIWPTEIPQFLPPPELPQDPSHPIVHCIACSTYHKRGFCPLKLAGPETCNLCGLAHYGVARSCPHIRSETQLRDMLAALRQSPEPRHLVELAKKYLSGVKGTVVQAKKIRADRAAQLQGRPDGQVVGPDGRVVEDRLNVVGAQPTAMVIDVRLQPTGADQERPSAPASGEQHRLRYYHAPDQVNATVPAVSQQRRFQAFHQLHGPDDHGGGAGSSFSSTPGMGIGRTSYVPPLP